MEERQKTLFAQRVAELRKERGETQAEFSQRTGVRQQTISGYENGKVSPTLDAVIQIAKACDVSVDWLCGLIDTKRNKFTEYADVIMALVNIGEAIKGKLYLVMEEVEKFGYDDSWVEEEIALRIEDEEIQKFLKSWNDILPLVKSNTISRNLYEYLKDGVYLQFDGTHIKNERNFENGCTDKVILPEKLNVCVLRSMKDNSIIFSRFEIIKYMMSKIKVGEIRYYGNTYDGSPSFNEATKRIQEKIRKYYNTHKEEIEKYKSDDYSLEYIPIREFVNKYLK